MSLTLKFRGFLTLISADRILKRGMSVFSLIRLFSSVRHEPVKMAVHLDQSRPLISQFPPAAHDNREATKTSRCVGEMWNRDTTGHISFFFFPPLGWPHFALPVHKDSSGLRHYLASTLGLEEINPSSLLQC